MEIQDILNGTVSGISEFSLVLISSWMQFLFLTVVPKYLKTATSSKELLD
jgi:hypothetical protein